MRRIIFALALVGLTSAAAAPARADECASPGSDDGIQCLSGAQPEAASALARYRGHRRGGRGAGVALGIFGAIAGGIIANQYRRDYYYGRRNYYYGGGSYYGGWPYYDPNQAAGCPRYWTLQSGVCKPYRGY